jgi:mannose-6-phosphate isomerase
MHEALRLRPIFKERVWGGDRLAPGSPEPIGEAWVVFEGCEVDGGPWDGLSLGEVAQQSGAALLGTDVVQQTGTRFPLLVKLLHSMDWLSVQVHPDDEQAARLEGPGHFGKTEAWHILEAEKDARVVYGLDGRWSRSDLEQLIQHGQFERALRRMSVAAGDTLFTPAGCVHAIGPGLFIYEVQQTSDITYRLFDWNRPASAGRELHLDKGLSVIGECAPIKANTVIPEDAPVQTLTECEFFSLDIISTSGAPITLSTYERSFHALTVTSGDVTLSLGGRLTALKELDSIVIPAASGEYQLAPAGSCSVLLARVC